MSVEINMNHLGVFCATVVAVFTSLPWGKLLVSALKVSKKSNLPSFLPPR